MKEFDRLFEIIKTLRSDNGCPWDREQTFETMAPSLIEEVYEIVDAVEDNKKEDLQEELGDLFFLTLFVSYLGEQSGRFKTADVLNTASDKLVRRHPHVFGNLDEKNVDQIIVNWESIKSSEIKNKDRKTPFDGIPRKLPEIQRFFKILEKAKRAHLEIEKITDDELLKSLGTFLKKKNDKNLACFIGKFLIYTFSRNFAVPALIRKIGRSSLSRYKNISKK